MHPRHSFAITLVGALVFGCGASPVESSGSNAGMGRVALALRTSVGEAVYELRDAVFDVSGPVTAALNSEEDPEATVIEQELPVGEYSVTLEPDWSLFMVGDAESTEVAASLVTDNPTSFSISADSVTRVAYAFEVEGSSVALGTGGLEIGIDVAQGQAHSVLFTEMMIDPAELADSSGEWLELQNAGEDSIDLNGCVIQRDTNQFTIDTSLELEPGGIVTLANGDAPGFTPDYVYSGLTLPNTAVFVLSLTCGNELLDSVTVDPATWPGSAGVADSLSASVTTAAGNDALGSWCAATAPYTTDLGTPGSANASCE